ncbi:hypothetical protein RBSWK_00626 [Rhodopirellula baltica SWK14]|uniref:Uncharacterized protein n=1 Tax=Rhodopirellula baltica SWK14 TaxID=993516 RepID=L7CNH5_RHOBT|nr:hypothetical protein RBSWK_00626 [Rhodopirellula baltica SWK14]
MPVSAIIATTRTIHPIGTSACNGYSDQQSQLALLSRSPNSNNRKAKLDPEPDPSWRRLERTARHDRSLIL